MKARDTSERDVGRLGLCCLAIVGLLWAWALAMPSSGSIDTPTVPPPTLPPPTAEGLAMPDEMQVWNCEASAPGGYLTVDDPSETYESCLSLQSGISPPALSVPLTPTFK